MSEPIMLHIPCAPEILPELLRGVTTSRIRLEEIGDGTCNLIVNGPRGPLSDPFADVRESD